MEMPNSHKNELNRDVPFSQQQNRLHLSFIISSYKTEICPSPNSRTDHTSLWLSRATKQTCALLPAAEQTIPLCHYLELWLARWWSQRLAAPELQFVGSWMAGSRGCHPDQRWCRRRQHRILDSLGGCPEPARSAAEKTQPTQRKTRITSSHTASASGWAVSQHTGPSKSTKATLKCCYMLHSSVTTHWHQQEHQGHIKVLKINILPTSEQMVDRAICTGQHQGMLQKIPPGQYWK